MCFLPKSLASIDHSPGPTIASAAPIAANRMAEVESPALNHRIDAFAMTASTPASGVHKPTIRKMPATAPIPCGAIITNDGGPDRELTP